MVITSPSLIYSVGSINVVIRDYLPFKPALRKTRAKPGCSKRHSARMLALGSCVRALKPFLMYCRCYEALSLFSYVFIYCLGGHRVTVLPRELLNQFNIIINYINSFRGNWRLKDQNINWRHSILNSAAKPTDRTQFIHLSKQFLFVCQNCHCWLTHWGVWLEEDC